ncbi:TIGR00341 family protein [uncultured Coprobacter sp.]|mgnify:FL=1|jgi:TIGR00341 family protein|uniref:TIGR00341 family protein n=1 Tax=uncultured Coprobacter sp. TaxID=1720550 RepID=UPI0025F8FDD4|nr:TIGR00341 family protein [uncultured Coprobacter sp.]
MFFKESFLAVRQFLGHYLDQSQDRESEQVTVEAIREGIEFKGSTIWILIFAIFIASLGLNTNSTAVIIGAMLISPLMGPIMGIGLGLGINDFELIKKSFRNLGVATIFSVLTSTLYFLISPLNEARSELLARTSPTIYDVLIALFGGLAGIVAMATKQKGNVIPGVAIATALMPPLCTAGFGLANGNMHYFFGAFYLFFINSVFIAFATTMGVKAMKFSKKQFVDKDREKTVQRIVYSILLLTMTPSVIITYNMIRQNYFETSAFQFVNQQFNLPDIQVLSKTASFENGQKVIRVSLIGQELSKDSILSIESRLPKYGLTGTKLILSQGFASNREIDLKSLNSMMFKDIYKDNQQRIALLNKKVDSLQTVVSRYQQYDTIGIAISPEIKILFPLVENIAVTKSVFSSVETGKLDTMTLAVVRYAKPMSKAEQSRFVQWLEARLAVRSIKIVTE